MTRALRFNDTTALSNHGIGSVLARLNTLTWLSWIYHLSALPGDARLWQKGYVGANNIWNYVGWFNENPGYSYDRGNNGGASRFNVSAVATNFAAFGLTKWLCLAGQSLDGGVATDHRLFLGDEDQAMAEPSSYGAQSFTNGVTVNDSSAPLTIGNRANGNASGNVLIARLIWWNRYLTYQELVDQQFEHRLVVPGGNILDVSLGMNGVGQQLDQSPYGNHGTLTGNFTFTNKTVFEGPRLADPAPLRYWFMPAWETGGAPVVVTPAAASATSAVVAPTTVLGSLSIAPAVSSAGAAVVDPTVVNVVLLTPSPASSLGAVVAPTVVNGSLTVAPATATAQGAVAAPTVVNHVTLAPAAATGQAAVVDPTVVNAVTLAPSAVAAMGAVNGPTVVNPVILAPSPASAIGAVVDPSVQAGSGTDVSPAPATAAGAVVAPAVVEGSLSMSPVVASAGSDVAGPAAVQGSLSLAPAPAAGSATVSPPTVVLGAISLMPAPAFAQAAVSDPAVVLGAILVVPGAASAVAAVGQPLIPGGFSPEVVGRTQVVFISATYTEPILVHNGRTQVAILNRRTEAELV